MEKEGAVQSSQQQLSNLNEELKSLEGTKCRAPHLHQWGAIMYHNAMVCSVVSSNECHNFEEIEVKVMFTNPTHQEMLPCPYYLESFCKFDEEQCKYSHGNSVKFSELQEYVEPNFENLQIGGTVLAKENDNLWYRAKVKNIFEGTCSVVLESNRRQLNLKLCDVFPLEKDNEDESDLSSDEKDPDDIINMSLINTPLSQALGDWEKYTKGIGSKIMERMGYITGTGLGRFADGRTEPVTAVVLPPGKSLDHCMKLREKANGDKNLFNLDKKMKRLQKKQEKVNKIVYEKEKRKTNVFSFLNKTLAQKGETENLKNASSIHRKEIKKETSRNLNVAKYQIDAELKHVEKDLIKIKQALARHSDAGSQINKSLMTKLHSKQTELQNLKAKSVNIINEQNLRNDKKKLTIF